MESNLTRNPNSKSAIINWNQNHAEKEENAVRFGGGAGQLLEELESASLQSLTWNLTQKWSLPGDGDRKYPLTGRRAHIYKIGKARESVWSEP